MLPCRGRFEMRVLLAGATGAIGRPLIRSLKQNGHSLFCLVRSAESTRILGDMGAEALIGDALDAAFERWGYGRASTPTAGADHRRWSGRVEFRPHRRCCIRYGLGARMCSRRL